MDSALPGPSGTPSSISLSPDTLPEGISYIDDIVIALMGVTGSGKSTFIKTVTGREDIVIGDKLTSETIECQAYPFEESGLRFALVDTPGFNDTWLDDAAILAQLAKFMEAAYRAKTQITAIIYLQPITNKRLEGSALDNLSMFRKLCGPKCYSNVVLATSFWSCIDEATGARREAELAEKEEFWGGMVRRGSQVVRLPDGRAECVDLIMKLAQKSAVVLQIQHELVNQGVSIAETEAGASVKDYAALEALRQDFTSKLAEMAKERAAELQHHKAEFKKIMRQREDESERKLKQQREEFDRLQAVLEKTSEAQERSIKELAEQSRIDKAEVDRIRLQMERVAIESEKRDAARKRNDEIAHIKSKFSIAQARQQANLQLLQGSQVAGRVKVSISNSFTAGESTGRYTSRICNRCGYICSAKLAYVCHVCSDFDLCSNCFDEGRRCFDLSRKSLPARSLVGTEIGKCRRALKPIGTGYRVPCNRCNRFLDGLYLHCCRCNTDDYDLCLDCVCAGSTCLDENHELQIFYGKYM